MDINNSIDSLTQEQVADLYSQIIEGNENLIAACCHASYYGRVDAYCTATQCYCAIYHVSGSYTDVHYETCYK